MKIAYVVPRYGSEVLGGAEHACRMLAERLVAMAGWQVEIFTTCATDAVSWGDTYPSGTSVINGVTVHRFKSLSGRDPLFHDFASRLLSAPEKASVQEAERFIELQGPVCPAAVEAAVGGDSELLIFYPYLFYPTVKGVPAAGRRAVMHPAAHDEPALRLPVFPAVFHAASGLVFQTMGEQALCHQLFGRSLRNQIVLGLGVDVDPEGVPATLGRDSLGLGSDPYLLSVGRLEDGKGTTMLGRFFAEYKKRRPGPLKLVMAGQVVQAPPAHGDVLIPGPVSDDVKRALLAGCTAFVQPSFFEAFSLALIEAWSAGAPAVVNGRCSALTEHSKLSGAGLWFSGYATFEAVLDRLLGDAKLRNYMGECGRAYVSTHYSWPALIDRYRLFLGDVARHKNSR